MRSTPLTLVSAVTLAISLLSGCHSSSSGADPFGGGFSPVAADAASSAIDAGSPAPVSSGGGGSIVSPDASPPTSGDMDAALSDAAPLDSGSAAMTERDAASSDSAANDRADGGAGDGSSLDGGLEAGGDAAFDGALPSDASVDAAVDGAIFGDAAGDAGSDAAVADAGSVPYAVGTLRIELKIDAQRTIPVQLWYPAVESARAEATQGHATAEFEPAGARRDQLSAMLANSPAACTNKTMHAALAPDVLAQAAPFPALLFSHCQDCVRFSTFSVAEQLARLGFVVAAPDHVKGTIYDGTGLLDEAFLQTRATDIRKVLDMLLDAGSTLLPAGLRGRIDANRVGIYGHSYGSLTTGRVMRDDARVKAGVMIAAPIDLGSPLDVLLPSGADVTKLKQPGLFFEASEDAALMNTFVEDNFARYPNPTWLVQVKDAGHWSFTDIAGFNGNFQGGCGTGTRQGSLFETFTYADIGRVRELTKAYVAAFFQAQLRGDAAGKSYLTSATPADLVTLKRRP